MKMPEYKQYKELKDQGKYLYRKSTEADNDNRYTASIADDDIL